MIGNSKRKGKRDMEEEEEESGEEEESDDDIDDDIKSLEPLNDLEKQYLSNVREYEGEGNWYWGDKEGNGNAGRVLHNLLHPRHLNMWHTKGEDGDILGTREEVQEDIDAVVKKKILTERYDKLKGDGRSSSAASGQLHHRTLYYLQKRERYNTLIEAIRQEHEKLWRKQGKLKGKQKVVITKCWFCKALSKDENKGDGDAGDFAIHFDNFGRGSIVRVITTIMDSKGEKKKIMGFECQDSSNRVMFDAPHGSIISMDEEAAGSNEARNYRHWIKGAEDTYTLCLELGIGDENHGDLRGCSWKEDEEGTEEGDEEAIAEEKSWKEQWELAHLHGE